MPRASDVAHADVASEQTELIHDTVKKCAKKNFDVVLAVTGDKLDSAHYTLKLAEQKYGVPTMHIWRDTINKACGDRGGVQVMSNLALKVSLSTAYFTLFSSTKKPVE